MPGAPPNSPIYGLPRYANTDAVDFAGQINAIVDLLDARAHPKPPLVSTYPVTGPFGSGSLMDGQECYLVFAAGGLWHLRYNASSTLAIKWEFLGGLAWGSLSARPPATICPVGARYRATDTGITYEGDGAVWTPGAWTALTLAANVSTVAGYNAPAARLVANGVQLRGLATAGAVFHTYAPLATVPTAMKPPSAVFAPAVVVGSTGAALGAVLDNTAGQFKPWLNDVQSGDLLVFDGLTYPLS